MLNEGVLADSAGETSRTYRKRIFKLLIDTKLTKPDIFLMLAASLVTTNEGRFFQALSAITTDDNSNRVAAWAPKP